MAPPGPSFSRASAVEHPQDSAESFKSRLLILCFDGTSNTYNEKGNTNVVRLFVALDKSEEEKQLCYYQPGIGTYISPTKPFARVFSGTAKLFDMAFATYMEDHILGGYRFLMENYREGDKICLFGFSRGGYIARCLAGMLHNVGLLAKGNEELLPFAWRNNADDSFAGVKRAHNFKEMARPVGVEFLGVWDTVTSVSFAGRTLPFTNSNVVRHFRQALALDERRVKFRHNPWSNPQVQIERMIRNLTPNFDDHFISPRAQGTSILSWTRIKELATLTHPADLHQKSDDAQSHQELCKNCRFHWERPSHREVWFVGCHSDVGGGAAPNSEEHTLANPSLLWMVQQIEKTALGVLWSESAFEGIPSVRGYLNSLRFREPPQTPPIQPDDPAGPISLDKDKGKQRPPPDFKSYITELVECDEPEFERMEQFGVVQALAADVQDEIHDHLSGPSGYWILEFLPFWKHFLGDYGARYKKLNFNWGRGRKIQDRTPLFHFSVRMKEDADEAYKPRARFRGEPEYVYC